MGVGAISMPEPTLTVMGQTHSYPITRLYLSLGVGAIQHGDITLATAQPPKTLACGQRITVQWTEAQQQHYWHGLITAIAHHQNTVKFMVHSPLWWLTQWRHIAWYPHTQASIVMQEMLKSIQHDDPRLTWQLACVDQSVQNYLTHAASDWVYWQWLTRDINFVLMHQEHQVCCQVGQVNNRLSHELTLWQSGRIWQWQKNSVPLPTPPTQASALPGVVSNAVCQADHQIPQPGQMQVVMPDWFSQQQITSARFSCRMHQGVDTQSGETTHSSSGSAQGVIIIKQGASPALQWLGGLADQQHLSIHKGAKQTHASWVNHYGSQMIMQARGWQYERAFWQAITQTQEYVSYHQIGQAGSMESTTQQATYRIGNHYTLFVGQRVIYHFDPEHAGTFQWRIDVDEVQEAYGKNNTVQHHYQHGRYQQHCHIVSNETFKIKQMTYRQQGNIETSVQGHACLRLTAQVLSQRFAIPQQRVVYQRDQHLVRQFAQCTERVSGQLNLEAYTWQGRFTQVTYQVTVWQSSAQHASVQAAHLHQQGNLYQNTAAQHQLSATCISPVAKVLNIG